MSLIKKDSASVAHSPFESLRKAAHNPLVRAAGELWLVLDVSGSMYGEPVEQLRIAAQRVIDENRSKVQVNVVAFATRAFIMSHGVDDLQAHGSTNMADGIKLLARAAKGSQAILMSDGHPNSVQSALDAAKAVADRIVINTMAFGDDADTALLRNIAAITGGKMYEVGEAVQLPQAFAQLASKAVAALTAGEVK